MSTIALEIIKYAPPGHGMGYHDGRAVFVPGTCPGDRILARITLGKKRYAQAEMVELQEAGAQRRSEPCQHARECGGCTLLHLAYPDQLALKDAMLREVCAGQKVVVDAFLPLEPSPQVTGYRHRAHIRMEKSAWGFRRRGSHDVVATPHCLVVSDGIKDAATRYAQQAQQATAVQFLQSLSDSVVAGCRIPDGGKPRPLNGFAAEITEDYGYGRCVLRADGFAQCNPVVVRRMAHDVAQAIPLAANVTELYCGSGTFSQAILSRAQRFYGYELSESALALARRNTSQFPHASFCATNLERSPWEGNVDVIVVDPPRTGLARRVTEQILASRATQLCYVSCNPATLARDLHNLGEGKRGFRVASVCGYDMYPHTTHVEVLARLTR
ncbi:class I SAM-dependent RNA methyltransferase [Chrysiogenes arsenatis]|uniref:class I SAM-dependent RNA methyltransferase n=1 Tax=Chrysiogenes arsenatis TaxID=309797 RepID=UPI000401B567|nr:TRAM domain-containing protein [Chrysiogenes arsenatis]